MSEQLRECPFCGGKANIIKCNHGNGFEDVIKRKTSRRCFCTKCNIRTYFYGTKQKAIKAWNKRYNEIPHLGKVK